jgi:hypothetical protein
MRLTVSLKPNEISPLIKPRSTPALPICEYGACSSSNCNCKSYEGTDNTCNNCDCNYDKHW